MTREEWIEAAGWGAERARGGGHCTHCSVDIEAEADRRFGKPKFVSLPYPDHDWKDRPDQTFEKLRAWSETVTDRLNDFLSRYQLPDGTPCDAEGNPKP